MPIYVFKCPACKKEITRDYFKRRPKALRSLCEAKGIIVRAPYVRTIRKPRAKSCA